MPSKKNNKKLKKEKCSFFHLFFSPSANMVLIRNFVLLPSAELLLFLCGVLTVLTLGLFRTGNYFVLFYPCFGCLLNRLIITLAFLFVVSCWRVWQYYMVNSIVLIVFSIDFFYHARQNRPVTNFWFMTHQSKTTDLEVMI